MRPRAWSSFARLLLPGLFVCLAFSTHALGFTWESCLGLASLDTYLGYPDPLWRAVPVGSHSALLGKLLASPTRDLSPAFLEMTAKFLRAADETQKGGSEEDLWAAYKRLESIYHHSADTEVGKMAMRPVITNVILETYEKRRLDGRPLSDFDRMVTRQEIDRKPFYYAEKSPFAEVTDSLGRTESLNMKRSRGLRGESGYVGMVGAILIPTLQRVKKKKGRWLEIGAGSAQAVRDAYGDDTIGPIETVVVDPFRPADAGLKDFEQKHPKTFTYHSGRYFEQFDPAELGKFDVATAVMSLNYSPQLSEPFEKALKSLNRGGVFYFNLGPRTTRILTPQGAIPLTEWLNRIKGVELTRTSLYGFELRKTSVFVRVPRLELYDLAPGVPPIRTYLLVE